MISGDAEGPLADLRRRLDDLAAQTVAGQTAAAAGTSQQLESLRARVAKLESLPAELERLATAAAVGQETTVETLRGVIERLARNTESLQQATLDMLRAEMERMGAAMGDRLAALESLPGDVQGVYRELDRIAELTSGRDADLTRLRERSGPLEEAVAGLRADLERARAEMAAASRSAMAAAAERMDGLAARLTDVEPVQLDIHNLRRDLERVVEEVTVAQQAALSAAGEQFSAQARLRSLEALPATVESLQRDVIGLTREAAAARESAVALVGKRMAPVEESVAGARRDLDDLSATAAAATERLAALEARLAALQPVPDETERHGRELVRLAADVAAARTETGERAAALEERVAALESLPADVQGVYRELDKVAEMTAGRAAELAKVVGPTGMLRTEIDALRREVARVSEEASPQALRTEVDALTQEVDRVVELSSTHDVALAQLAGRTTPVETAVGDLQGRLDQLADDLVALRRHSLASADEHLSSLAGRISALESLPQEVERMAETLHGLGDQVRDAAQAASSAVIERTAPVEASLEALRLELQRVAADVVAVQRANRAPAAFHLKALEKQVGELERRLGAGRTADSAGLAELDARLAGLEGKLRALESLPADVEGVYAALYRVADDVKTARRDAALA